MKQQNRTKILVEVAFMVALATVLSVLKVAELPYGGSVTLASMLPILLISYRHGVLWGLAGGAVHATLQQLLGLSNLMWFTTWQSVVAVILLDYVLAFTLVGLGGVFRRVIRRQHLALAAGAVLVSLLRYACHVLAGATVWAGLSIPTEAALAYSFGYNATYMLPEAIVLVLAAWYLGTLLDFRRETPVRLVREEIAPETGWVSALAGFIGFGVLVADVTMVFGKLQNAETGEFDIAGLTLTPFVESVWLPVLIVTAVGAALVTALLLLRRRRTRENERER